MLTDLADWVTDVINAIGYVGVALLVAIENVFPPIPSEVVLPFAGFVASDGDANLLGMVLAATVGSMVGAYLLYGIAAAVGRERLHYLIAKHGRWARLSVTDLERAEAWFDRRASVALVVGRCVPVVRAVISFPAGINRMPLATFSLYTFLGSAIWNSGQILAGYLLRDRWEDVVPVMETIQWLVVGALLALVLGFVWSRFLSPAARRGERSDRTRDAEVIAAWDATHPEA